MSGPLAGLKVLELAGIGPGPFCGMMLADMGAEVIRIERPGGNPAAMAGHSVLFRSRRSIAIDLKQPAGIQAVLRLVDRADALFEGFRPGVTERLGIGPDECLERNAKLVYGRMTGWGQDGPLAQTAGHDINYIALSGALHGIGRAGEKPVPPLNLVGDFGGGGMVLAFGMVCALLEAQRSGRGQVVDASMVEGASALMAMFHSFRQQGMYRDERGTNLLDTGAPFYEVYETADHKYITIGALEPQFYATLKDKLDLPDDPFAAQMNPARWPEQRDAFKQLFKTRTRAEWCELLEGSDACFAPVLELGEAADHPHNAARQSFVELEGNLQPGPTPRFSRSKPAQPWPAEKPGTDTRTVLLEAGFSRSEIDALLEQGAVAE